MESSSPKSEEQVLEKPLEVTPKCPSPSSFPHLGPPSTALSASPAPPSSKLPIAPVSILLLQEMPNGRGTTSVPVPCLLQDLRQIKGDICRFSDDPDKYTQAFQNVTQVFNLTWRDVILLLGQTLTAAEKQPALQAAEKFRDEQYVPIVEHKGKEETRKVRK